MGIEMGQFSQKEEAEIEERLFFLTKPSFSRRFLQSLAALFLKCLCRTYFKMGIKGAENLPAGESFLLASNHTSHLDSVALILASGRPIDDFVFMAAKDYFFKGGFYTGLMTSVLNLIPFDRGVHYKGIVMNLEYLRQCREAKKIIVLYPEGTRSLSGELQKFKVGIGFFSNTLNMPIVPSYIAGSHHLYPKGKLWPKPGKFSVCFGAPIHADQSLEADTINFFDQSHKQLTELLRERISDLRDR